MGDRATVIVDRDETRSFQRTRYTVASSVLTSPVDDTSFVQAGAGAATRTMQDKARDIVSVTDFSGVDPYGVTDSAAGIIAALAAYNTVDLGSFDYLIGQTINLTGGKRLISKGARILKNFDGVGLAFSGGSAGNYVEGDLDVIGVGAFASSTASPSTSPTAHGVTITNSRMFVTGRFQSYNHKGSGFVIASTGPNSNRSIYDALHASSNGEHGIHFSGTWDDCSVWQISLYANGNRKSGITSDDDYAGRNWRGFIHSEANAVDTTSSEVYLGKLRNSVLDIYAERSGTSTGREINAGANTAGLIITSYRENNDIDGSINTNEWRLGNRTYVPANASAIGYSGIVKSFRWKGARDGNPAEGTKIRVMSGATSESFLTASNSANAPYAPTIAIETGDSRVQVGSDTLRLRAGGVDYVRLNGGTFNVGAADAITPTVVAMFGSCKIFTGAGTPDGVVTASRGSIFMRYDGGAGTCLYVKESGSGNTGWVAK